MPACVIAQPGKCIHCSHQSSYSIGLSLSMKHTYMKIPHEYSNKLRQMLITNSVLLRSKRRMRLHLNLHNDFI